MGFHPGDRIQMVSCKDPHHPLLPGEKGTIDYIDDAGTLHCRWDNRRRFGVCLKEDEVRKIPVEQEWELLHSASVMQCDEVDFDAHCKETDKLIDKIEAHASKTDGEWVVRSSYLDPAHIGKEPVFEFAGTASLDALLQACDVKQGVDIAFTARRPQKEQSILLVAYGQNYTLPDGTSSVVTEVLECKLVSPAVARDFHERMDVGWEARGGAAAHLFSSAPDHESISACIRDCKAVVRSAGKDHGLDR